MLFKFRLTFAAPYVPLNPNDITPVTLSFIPSLLFSFLSFFLLFFYALIFLPSSFLIGLPLPVPVLSQNCTFKKSAPVMTSIRSCLVISPTYAAVSFSMCCYFHIFFFFTFFTSWYIQSSLFRLHLFILFLWNVWWVFKFKCGVRKPTHTTCKKVDQGILHVAPTPPLVQQGRPYEQLRNLRQLWIFILAVLGVTYAVLAGLRGHWFRTYAFNLFIHIFHFESRDSAVGSATSYGSTEPPIQCLHRALFRKE
jgi:hypothetical protein